MEQSILQQLDVSPTAWQQLLDKWNAHTWHDADPIDETTNVLLVDASLVTVDGKPDLDALHQFLKQHVKPSIRDLDLVSLFPYTIKPTDTALDPRVRLYEDLGHFADDFELMYDVDVEAYHDKQFDLVAETDALLGKLAFGASKLIVHLQSFHGMDANQVKAILALWRQLIHDVKPNGQLILADGMNQHALDPYADAVDVLSHFDLASHVMLALAQHDATRLQEWVRQTKTLPDGKTYFNFLSSAERDPFEKNILDVQTNQILAAHSILLSIQGIPAIDYRTFFGVDTPIEYEELVNALKTDAHRLDVYGGILSQLNVKRTQPALSPYAAQYVLDVDRRLFAVERKSETEALHLFTNVSDTSVSLSTSGTNLFTGEAVKTVTLEPYGVLWVKRT